MPHNLIVYKCSLIKHKHGEMLFAHVLFSGETVMLFFYLSEGNDEETCSDLPATKLVGKRQHLHFPQQIYSDLF